MYGISRAAKGGSGFPETVQVAVLVCGYNTVAFGQHKNGFRLLAGSQRLALVALYGFKRDPFDIMFRQHGVLCSAHAHRYPIAFRFNDRYMLFQRSVRGAGNDFLHRFAAAYDRYAVVAHISDNISTMLANIKFHIGASILMQCLAAPDSAAKRNADVPLLTA